MRPRLPDCEGVGGPSGTATAYPMVTNYTYEKANNRTQKQMMGSFKSESRFYRFFNKFNQITSVAGASGQTLVSYGYDKNGNRITREVNGDLDTYTWDGDNRLVALYVGTMPFLEPAGGTLNPTIPAVQSGFYRYTYDYRTRRTLREERQSENDPYAQRFVTFSGGTSVQERSAPELSSPVPVFTEVPTPVLVPPPTMTVAPSPVRRVLPPILTEAPCNLSHLVPAWARYTADADADGFPNLHEANSRHKLMMWKYRNPAISFINPSHPHPAIAKIPGYTGDFAALSLTDQLPFYNDGLTTLTHTSYSGVVTQSDVYLFRHSAGFQPSIDWDCWTDYFTKHGPELAQSPATVEQVAEAQTYAPASLALLPLVLRPDADMDRNGNSNWQDYLNDGALPEPKSMAGYIVHVGKILKDSLKAIELYSEQLSVPANFYTDHLSMLATFMNEGTGPRDERFRAFFTDAPRDFGAHWSSYVVDESGLPLCARRNSPNWRHELNATGGLKTNGELYTEFMTAQNATGPGGWTPGHYGQWAIGHILMVCGTVDGDYVEVVPTPESSVTAAGVDQALPQADVFALGTLEVEFIRGSDMGGGVGGLLYSKRRNAAGTQLEPSFNLSNGRGDVTTQTDANGNVTWQATYEAFGMRTAEAGENRDSQRANTKEEDPTGLLNEGFRYRDLEAGVFISRDPAGFVDGPNVYGYVVQNPWSKFDPEGLCFEWFAKKIEAGVEWFDQKTGFTRAVSNALDEGGYTEQVVAFEQNYNLESKIAKVRDTSVALGETLSPVSSSTLQKVEDGDLGGAAWDVVTSKVKVIQKIEKVVETVETVKEINSVAQEVVQSGNLNAVKAVIAGTVVGTIMGSSSNNEEELVYHGTDSYSAEDIEKNGLDSKKKARAGETHAGEDPNGFSVSKREKDAMDWAEQRAKDMGKGAKPVVLSAPISKLPPMVSRENNPKKMHFDNAEEMRILPKDYKKVKGGVFKRR